MPNLGDHASGLRRIRQFDDTPDAVETKPDQRLALGMMTANGAADLFDLYHFVGLAHVGLSARLTGFYSAACSPSPTSRRRACSVDPLILRRAATERGESWRLSASKVARTIL